MLPRFAASGSMNTFGLIADAADRMGRMIRNVADCETMDPRFVPGERSGLQWDNTLLTAPLFRRAHIEALQVAGRISVLHVCVLPHYCDSVPIFGFDIVAGPSRTTGIFLDLSPVAADTRWRPRLPRFDCPRPRPDWGDIFSADFLAIRPVNLTEVESAMDLAVRVLRDYLDRPRDTPPFDAWQSQMRYIRGQRRNLHTARMLASLVGEATARRFIDQVLFPLEPDPVQQRDRPRIFASDIEASDALADV